jgi:hypothetical protein
LKTIFRLYLFSGKADDHQYSLGSFIMNQILALVIIIVGIGFVILGFYGWSFKDSMDSRFTQIVICIIGLGFFCSVGMLTVEIYYIEKIRKYGLFIFQSISKDDSIWDESPLLIKLRDPRISMRRKCLHEILESWTKIEKSWRFDYNLYLKRIVFCMIDREPEIRNIAITILKEIFGKETQDVENLLYQCLNSRFYLIDKEIKSTFEKEGTINLKLN